LAPRGAEYLHQVTAGSIIRIVATIFHLEGRNDRRTERGRDAQQREDGEDWHHPAPGQRRGDFREFARIAPVRTRATRNPDGEGADQRETTADECPTGDLVQEREPDSNGHHAEVGRA
jgi:hypothetical protein